jgi:hypothetical protein
MWVGSRNAAPFDSRVTDPIFKTERLPLIWQNMAILSPDCGDARQLLIRPAGAFERGFKMLCIRREGSNNDVDIRGPKRLFPLLRTAFSGVSQ